MLGEVFGLLYVMNRAYNTRVPRRVAHDCCYYTCGVSGSLWNILELFLGHPGGDFGLLLYVVK